MWKQSINQSINQFCRGFKSKIYRVGRHMLTRFVALYGLKTKGWKPYFISDKSLPRFRYSGRKTKEIWFDWWQDNLISSSYSYKLKHKLLSTSRLWYKCKNPRWRPYITSSFSPSVLQTYTTAPQLLLLSPKMLLLWLTSGRYLYPSCCASSVENDSFSKLIFWRFLVYFLADEMK